MTALFSCEVETPPAKVWWCPKSEDAVWSFEIEVPPAKAWWCPKSEDAVCSFEIDVPPAEAGGVSNAVNAQAKLVIKSHDLSFPIRELSSFAK